MQSEQHNRERDQETMSDMSSSIEGVDDVYNEIMYHVLGQFLVTKDNKNIATVLDDLTTELRTFRKTLSKEISTLSDNIKLLELTNKSVYNMNNRTRDNSSIIGQNITSCSPSSSPAVSLPSVVSPPSRHVDLTIVESSSPSHMVSCTASLTEVVEDS